MKAQLFVLGGRDAGRSFDIETEATLGRDKSCEIRLADRSISRRHARLVYDGLDWFVEDLGSRNGVRFGKKKIERAKLADLDEFLLGELPLRFRLEPMARSAPEAPARPVAPPVPSAAGARAVEQEPEDELEGEIELEEEIHLGLDDAPQRAARAPVRPDARALSEPTATPGPKVAPPSSLSSSDARRAAILSEGSRSGLLRGDLSQQPGWVRLVVTLVMIGLFVGILFVVFRAVVGVRGTL